MEFTDLPLADRIAMALGGGLIVLGTVVLGVVELLAGNLAPVYQATVDGETVSALTRAGLPDGATVTTTPLIAPNVRATIVVAGLVVLFVYALYAVTTRRDVESTEPTTPQYAD